MLWLKSNIVVRLTRTCSNMYQVLVGVKKKKKKKTTELKCKHITGSSTYKRADCKNLRCVCCLTILRIGPQTFVMLQPNEVIFTGKQIDSHLNCQESLVKLVTRRKTYFSISLPSLKNYHLSLSIYKIIKYLIEEIREKQLCLDSVSYLQIFLCHHI